jgi:hypothetical protein
MGYEFWPNLAERCLCCGYARCAVYKGYYTRFLACPELVFHGLVVIRTALCRTLSVRFSLFPDFLIRYRRLSRLSLGVLQGFRARGSRLLDFISTWTERMPEAFDLPLSTAYAYLCVKLASPP